MIASTPWRIAAYLMVIIGGVAIAKLGVRLIFDVDLDWLLLVPQILGALLFLLFSVEYQRSKRLFGNSRFRLSLAGMFSLTVLAALFIASVLHIIRNSQREFDFSSSAQAAMQRIIGVGQTYSQARGGRFVVVVNRPSFSGDDLQAVIRAGKPDEASPSRIVSLSLWGTSVSELDLKQLDNCLQLEVLATSLGPFDRETVELLKGLKKLKSLIIDRKKFSDQQLSELSSALTGVHIQ